MSAKPSTAKITKILIANRGEIACRVIKTARKMGIATVAVYSDADRKALHVCMADEAVHIGASPAVQSYLVIDKIIDAAKQAGADAVHPGYGFLSENPDFVRACEAAGLIFIGPSAPAMEAMGLKDAAKALMDTAKVPITPGYHGKDQSPKLLKAKAGMIGYPVLIKAVAGGGGKGMRKVDSDADFDALLASCQREAQSSFGNADVLIEKYIQSPRHIEVQVFGDHHGNIVHMFERDCSLQRRHQKVIEEAPAPGMTAAVRKAMTGAAIKAAKAVDYVGAGTVEFIVDGSGPLRTDGFWFMEMNTRLQVEHPVTEMITGLDLVELQIRVAQGERLPSQNSIKMEGHAVEARLYAEDPSHDFFPSVGAVNVLDTEEFQDETGGMRIDTGFQAGDNVSIFYDPMISKIIGYGHSRDEACENTALGIIGIEVFPLITNAAFLINCLENKAFKNAEISTHFIEQQIENGLIPPDIRSCDEVYALAALRLYNTINESSTSPFSSASGFRLNMPNKRVWTFARKGEPVDVTIIKITRQFADIKVDEGEIFRVNLKVGPASKSIQASLRNYEEWGFKITPNYISMVNDAYFAQVYFYNFDAAMALGTANALTAPMPGKIIAVNVGAGDTVKVGDPLIVMEAMKMEITLDAPRNGVVDAIHVKVDDLVGDCDTLLELEDD